MSKVTYRHPLEEALGIEPGSTLNIEGEYAVAPASALSNTVERDEEDAEVDRKIDTIYETAMAAFKSQTEYLEIVEPRYAARNAEVAANYLSIALNAAATRARVKVERRRASTFVPFNGGSRTTNNLIVADRNEILRMIQVDDKKEELR